MSQARRKLFVDPEVQGSLVKRLLEHWAILFILTMVCLLTMDVFLNSHQTTIGQRLHSLWVKYGVVILVMIAMLPAFIYDTIKLSHRFVGPIYRLRVTLGSLAHGGTVAKVNIRENDFWPEMADDFNALLDRLEASEKRVSELEQSLTTEHVHSECAVSQT